MTYVEAGIHERIALRADLRGSPPVVVGQHDLLGHGVLQQERERDRAEHSRPGRHSFHFFREEANDRREKR